MDRLGNVNGSERGIELGKQRVKKSLQVLEIIDLALLLVTNNEFGDYEKNILDKFYDFGVPCILVNTKSDLYPGNEEQLNVLAKGKNIPCISFSIYNNSAVNKLIDLIRLTIPPGVWQKQSLLADLVKEGDIVLLITPIDNEAPEGRLILPQVQVIRDILDSDCVAVVLKEREVDSFLRNTSVKPGLVICDSSVILKADASIPKEIPLTGFSILLASYKGAFEEYLKGTPHINKLNENDRVLLLESCTHHTSCDDIGRVKIPRWMSQFTGKKLDFDIVSGLNHLSRPVNEYALVIQCGGCMITRKQLLNRLKPAIEAGIPVTNYGMAIAWMQGVYSRAVSPFVNQTPDEII